MNTIIAKIKYSNGIHLVKIHSTLWKTTKNLWGSPSAQLSGHSL